MLTRLGYYADKVIELGWLACAVLIPMFFNVYSSRVFEPDKISLLRSLVLIMTVAWLVKLGEGGYRAMSQQDAGRSASGKMSAAMRGAAESALPPWLGFLRVPMVIPMLTYALVYLVSTIFTVTPEATLLGSYQRLQGTFSQYSYMMLGFLVIGNMRTRKQLERLISFIILTSIPVAVYGLVQANRLDPLPWAGDTATRVASTMGNAIFVAAWLIITVPFTLYRFILGVNRMAQGGETAHSSRRSYADNYSWAVVANSAAVLLSELFFFLFSLKLVAGLPFPEAQLWFVVPLALAIFYGGSWLIEWLGSHRDEPAMVSIGLPVAIFVLVLTAFLAFVPEWSLVTSNASVHVDLNGPGFLWVLVFALAWGTIAALAYFFGGPTAPGDNPGQNMIPSALTVGYGLLLIIQLTCIYLTQSRGPWLGIGVGLVVFAVALWLVGRRQRVVWMTRIGGTASAIVLAGAIFIGVLNIPGSPLQRLDTLPVVGKGVERLSTLFRTEDGTGKVRTLIWQGASQLIASDPVRTIIGWGPESMYVVYNKFYPAELAHWELRNATPDRSHNVEFDHLVTMGVMGLMAYYFMLAAFFLYAIRLLKRARTIQDQLLTITLMSALTAHFIEIQTGIQIAATWTYFYLIIGMMVVFGYFITGQLREGAEVAAEPVRGSAQASGAASGVAMSVPVAAGVASTAGGASRQATPGQSQRSMAMGTGGNGKPTATANVKQKPKTGQGYSAGGNTGRQPGRDGGGYGQPRGGNQMSDGRRRQSQPQAQLRMSRNMTSSNQFINNPLWLIAYAVAVVAVFFVIWKVNVATVQADTLYKQGQAYDNASRWTESIPRYQKAIELQPNQDYYYLFLGRAYLEWAKIAQTEMTGRVNPNNGQQFTADDIVNERTARLRAAEAQLTRARTLNPRNTDHYANLGRLYLYWSDTSSSGGGDPSKTQLAADNMEKATENSPGNAQLWDELGVAYARNGQFDKAIETLRYAQTVDDTYVRTPFIRGQMLQERADLVKGALQSGQDLPKGGETDYGKLWLEACQAFSDSIKLDASYFVDNNMPDRIEAILEASQPFTRSNSTVDLSNVLTDTIIKAYQNEMDKQDALVTEFLTKTGELQAKPGDKVPNEKLDALWNDPKWATVGPGGQLKGWVDPNFAEIAGKAVVPYSALGYITFRLGDRTKALELYERAVKHDPTNYFNQKNYGSLLADAGKVEEGLQHLNEALAIIQTYPDLSTDKNKIDNYNQIRQEISRVVQLKP